MPNNPSFGTSLAQGAASSLVTGSIDSLIGGLANRIFLGSPEKQLDRQWQYQQKQMDHQAKLNREQYDYEFEKEAAYNDPSAQRARLEAAGLNPALMYGQGAGSPGVSASLGGVSGSSLSAPHGTMRVSGDPMAASEIEAISSRSRLDAANARLAESKAAQQEWETTFLNPFRQRIAESESLSADARADIDRLTARLSEANFETDRQLKIQQLRNLVTENNKALAEIDNLKASEEEKRERAALNRSLSEQAKSMARKAIAEALLSERRLQVWENTNIDPNSVRMSGIVGAIAQLVLMGTPIIAEWIEDFRGLLSNLTTVDGKKLTQKDMSMIEKLALEVASEYGEGVFYNK